MPSCLFSVICSKRRILTIHLHSSTILPYGEPYLCGQAIMSLSGDIKFMKILNEEKFIRNVENLINPAEVSDLYFFSTFKRLLPRFLFKMLLNRTSKKNPYMGFVIEPYCIFLFFKLEIVLISINKPQTKARLLHINRC